MRRSARLAKIKYTKNELKWQKDALKRFQRYLPTLILKKQQLQMEIRKVENHSRRLQEAREGLQRQLDEWVAVFGEDPILRNGEDPTLRDGEDATEDTPPGAGVSRFIAVADLRTETGNIAGVDIPVFQGIEFRETPYGLFRMPLWVDSAVQIIKGTGALDAEIGVLEEQARLLGEELRITSQRVNLFEKVKIPETRENIRIIQIYLGDQQTAAVVRGKMAKSKLLKVQE